MNPRNEVAKNLATSFVGAGMAVGLDNFLENFSWCGFLVFVVHMLILTIIAFYLLKAAKPRLSRK